jgi:hypothetical protein
MGMLRVSRLAVAAVGLSLPGLLYLVTRPIRIADCERFDGPSHWWMDPTLALALVLSPIAIGLGTAAAVGAWRTREGLWSTSIALLGVVLALAALSFMALEEFDRRHGRWGAPLPRGYSGEHYWWWGSTGPHSPGPVGLRCEWGG